jgi:LPPG:FO 2-phospho-L-lactate transferase
VDGEAIKGPAAKMMSELGMEVSAQTVASYYGGVIDGFVYDERDAALKIGGLNTVTFDTIMRSDSDRAALARRMLDWILNWGDSSEHLDDHSH